MNFHLSADYFLLRTPLYAFKDAFDFKKFVDHINDDNAFAESILLASPVLYEKLNILKKRRVTIDSIDSQDDKVLQSLYKYYIRMSTRCTPFGIFAGVSLGTFSEHNNLQLCLLDSFRKSVRLDMDLISKINLEILKDDLISANLRFFTNNTIYNFEHELRLVEYRYNGEYRMHHLINVEHNDYLKKLLKVGRKGARKSELASSIVDYEISFEDALAFVNELIDSKLLVSELEPLVTGGDNLERILVFLENNAIDSQWHLQLSKIKKHLTNISNHKVGESIKSYLDIKSIIAGLGIQHGNSYLLQVDLYKPLVQKSITKDILEDVKQVVNLYLKTNEKTENQKLAKFKEVFVERYGEQEVPLLEVLDSEMGIGYPAGEQALSDNAPLIKDLGVKNDYIPSRKSTDWHRYLYRLFVDALRRGVDEVEIDLTEINRIFPQRENLVNQLPESIYCNCSVFSEGGAKYRISIDLIGIGYSQLTGRFCYLNESINKAVADGLTESVQNTNKIFAEIIHIPQARIGNILLRPILSDYEIPILTRSSLDEEHTINLQDLLVSVVDDYILLRSKSKNKEVVPRLSSAHNFSLNPLPIYNFLCDLQFQGKMTPLFWDWGILNDFDFLPRVTCKGIVISKRRWILKREKDSKGGLTIENLKSYLLERNIPSMFYLSEGDNNLLISQNCDISLSILLNEFERNNEIQIEECLFNDHNLSITDGIDKFTNEILIPIKIKKDHPIREKSFNIVRTSQVERTFYPGSEWVFIKIYCGVKTADKVLTDYIRPLTEKLLALNLIDHWFFIRYFDPDPHIRFRLHTIDGNHTKIISIVYEELKPLFHSKFVSKVLLDTYSREIERYGSKNIDNSEKIFFVDSSATVEILNQLFGDEGDELRWLIALKGADHLLSAFSYSLEQKISFISILSESFRNEFKYTDKDSKKALSKKYRENKYLIENVLINDKYLSLELSSIQQILNRRKKKLSELFSFINDLSNRGELEVTVDFLLSSYLHMFINRMFRSKQRFQEMVIYDILEQYYKSQLIRNKAMHSVKGQDVAQQNSSIQ